MSKLAIPHNAWVFISDGQKALFLRNAGDETFPNLTAERVFVDENPRTHEQGTDRPGRGFKRAMTNRRSSMETTDWHELEKHHFAQRVASAIEDLIRTNNVRTLIVAAPPRTLAELRCAFPSDVQRHIIAEIDTDLTKHPISEIERHILG
jgi:protein required for attachment to host cells